MKTTQDKIKKPSVELPNGDPLQEAYRLTIERLAIQRQKLELWAEMREALREISERGPVTGYGSADALRLRLVATQSIARSILARADKIGGGK